MFYPFLTLSSPCFRKQYCVIGLNTRDGVCSLWRWNWILCQYGQKLADDMQKHFIENTYEKFFTTKHSLDIKDFSANFHSFYASGMTIGRVVVKYIVIHTNLLICHIKISRCPAFLTCGFKCCIWAPSVIGMTLPLQAVSSHMRRSISGQLSLQQSGFSLSVFLETSCKIMNLCIYLKTGITKVCFEANILLVYLYE